MKTILRTSAFALAAAGMAVSAVPAAARDYSQSWQQPRDRYGNDTRYYGRDYHSQPVYGPAQTWRGNDARYYCHKTRGTTGLIVGAGAGALLGHAVDGGYNHTLGTVVGGVVGALLGKKVAQHRTCR